MNNPVKPVVPMTTSRAFSKIVRILQAVPCEKRNPLLHLAMVEVTPPAKPSGPDRNASRLIALSSTSSSLARV